MLPPIWLKREVLRCGFAVGTAPTVIRVQTGPIDFDEGTTVKFVGTVGGNHLYLPAPKATIFSVVVV